MAAPRNRNKNYFFISLVSHAVVLLVFVLGLDFTSPLAVIENTNKHDIISAVVLGDTPTSHILPQQPPAKPPEQAKPQLVKAKPVQPVEIKKDVIALKLAEKKKLAQQKALQAKMQKELFAKDLLADIKTQKDLKKVKQKKLKTQFEKTLREQAEASLRKQLLNEEVKLQGTQNRESQGEVNKYKALILQAIETRWIIPPQTNKGAYCMLLIRLAPGGLVLDVQVTRSSGNPALDSSARAAVFKASPLPVPTDGTFEAFRQIALKMKPENILANDGGMTSG